MEQVKLLALTLVLVGATAHAQPQDDAKAHFKRGTELYDENNFRGALVEFQKAYELSPSYKLLFNIGQVEMELQDYAGAVKAYTRYLREGGPDVPPPRVQQVQAEIDRLKGRIGHITIQTAPGAEVLVDEVSLGFAPLPEPATVNAGRHTVTIHVGGRDPQSRAVDVAGQEQVTVVLGNELAPAVAAPLVQTEVAAKPRGKTAMYVAWGATGAFAVVAGVFAYTAHNDSDDLAKLRMTFPVTKAQLDSAASKTSTAAAIADGFTAGAVVAGGIALYLTLAQPARSEKTVRLHVTPTGAYLAGQF